MSIISVNGTLALFFANFFGKIFGAVYRIPLSNVLGAEGIGIYQMAFPIYSFLLCILTGGISVTLSKKIASARARNDMALVQENYYMAKKVSFWGGVILFLLLILFSYPLAIIQGNKSVTLGYFAISIGFVFASMLGGYRGYFQGFGNMMPTAISQIIEQVSKLILGLGLSIYFLRYGILWGVFGALIGVSISEIICFFYFAIINRKIPKTKVELKNLNYKKFIKECMPISATYGMLPLSALIDSFLVVNLLNISGFSTAISTSLYGIETGMILPLINMPNVIISAIAIIAVPEISYALSSGKDISNNIAKMFKLAYIFILPCGVGLFILARPVLELVYPTLSANMLDMAVELLRISVFEMFFLCFVTISNAILQSLGKTKTPVYSLLFAIITKIIISVILITNSKINIFGLVIASTLGYFVSSIINVIKIKKQAGFKLTFLQIIFPIVSSVVMGIILTLLISLSDKNYMGILGIIALCASVYFLILILFKQISKNDFKSI